MSSIYEQMRANRAAQAEQRRADRAQQAEIRRADRAEAREQDRADRRDRAQQRQSRHAAARARWASRGAWLAARPVELVMSLIVAVPAVLAWSAMAAYGTEIYGPVGAGLPLFSEAGMWAFAFAAHRARREQRPTGWLLAGLWAFTGVAGLLNFLHGLDMPGGGLAVGLVMALVSIGGVVAHQLITAAPMRTRRTRAQRRDAATARKAARRVVRMERAALRTAVGQLDSDGRVRLLHAPGTVTLRRAWTGRSRLERATVPGLGEDGPDTPGEDPAAALVGEVEAWLASEPEPVDRGSLGQDSPGAIEARSGSDRAQADVGGDLRESRHDRGSIREPQRRSIEGLRTELRAAIEQNLPLDEGRPIDPASAESIRRGLRCSPKTARTLRDEWNDGGTAAPARA